jgi:hypothetical protein
MGMWILAAGLGLVAAVSLGSAGHASAGTMWGVTVAPKPDGSSGDVTINGTSLDYGTEPPATVSVTPYARHWDPSVPPPVCDAFLFRNGAQQDAQATVNAHPWTVSLGGEIRWMVRVTCPSPQGATAGPVEVSVVSHAKPVPVVASTPSPTPAAPKPSASTPAPVPATQRPAALPQAPAGKVVSVAVPPASPVAPAPPSPSSPAAPVPVAAASSASPTLTPSVAPSPSPATPLVDAAPASTPAAALAVAPRAKGGGVPWVLLILVCVVVVFGGTLLIRSRGLR